MFLLMLISFSFFFFFNDTATTEIYTLSLHDALPIFSPSILWMGGSSASIWPLAIPSEMRAWLRRYAGVPCCGDRKSTRLNSSHVEISYAVFCLKKKKEK